jgi:crotonobetaine/carnitine-CoA ligase
MHTDTTTWHVLRAGAARVPDKIALRDAERALTYAEVLSEVTALSGGLWMLDVRRGAVVAFMLGNHVDHALLWLATGSMGAIECSLNPELRGELLASVLRDSDAHVLVAEASIVREIGDALSAVPQLKVVVVHPDSAGEANTRALPGISTLQWSALFTEMPPDCLGKVDGSDIFGLIYTSGSTGRPKGVLVRHAQTYLRCQPNTPGTPGRDDVTLVALPMFHVVGLCRGVYGPLIHGGTAVFVPRFSASQFWQQAKQTGATCAPMLGSMASFLAAQPPRADDRTHGMRWVSMAPPIAAVDDFRRRFAVEIYTSYGLTEAVALTSGRASGRGNGWMRPDFEMRLVDDLDREVELGAVGELIVRPKRPWTTMAGYHNDPAATLRMLRNLWLHTGDLFQELDDGELRFAGRKGDRIRRRGENIAAGVIEERAASHSQVSEAFAVAVPDDEGIEDEILLCVVPSGQGPEPRALHEYLAGQLPAYMVPRYILVSKDLPVTSSQKVDRGKLQEKASEAWDAKPHARRASPNLRATEES